VLRLLPCPIKELLQYHHAHLLALPLRRLSLRLLLPLYVLLHLLELLRQALLRFLGLRVLHSARRLALLLDALEYSAHIVLAVRILCRYILDRLTALEILAIVGIRIANCNMSLGLMRLLMRLSGHHCE
jgi:hypothetical protein